MAFLEPGAEVCVRQRMFDAVGTQEEIKEPLGEVYKVGYVKSGTINYYSVKLTGKTWR